MKFTLFSLVLSSTLLSQSADFRFDSCDNCNDHIKKVVNSSSFWLSDLPSIHPMSQNRAVFQSGLSSPIEKYNGDFWIYPNLNFGIKVTRNLFVTGKLFGFSTDEESPQVLGAGLQYAFGDKDTLNWVTSIQRTDLKGLNHFRLTSITVDIRKWVDWHFIAFRLGIGSNFYKETSYYSVPDFPSKLEGQINYVGIDALMRYSILNVGIGSRFHPKFTTITFYLQKEFF